MEKRQMDVVVRQPAAAEIKAGKGAKVFWPGLDLVAILFWLYAIVKLFVIDVDVYLVSLANSDFVWLLNYKFLILVGLVSDLGRLSCCRDVGNEESRPRICSCICCIFSVRYFVLETPKIRLETKELAVRLRDSQCGNWALSLFQTRFYLGHTLPD